MYEINNRIACSHCDADGRLKLTSAIDFMQDCSQLWLESEPLLEQFFRVQNTAQFLVSRQLDVLRYPAYGERLTARTSVYECRGFYGFRNTVLYGENNLPCMESYSVGAFVNLLTGRLTRLPKEIIASVTIEPRHEMEYLDKKIDWLPENAEQTFPSIPVAAADIDFNRHMNNAKYVQAALAFLPEHPVKRLRVEYITPAKRGDLMIPKLSRLDEAKYCIALDSENGKPYTVMEFTYGDL